MSISEEIERLERLRNHGSLTEGEFQQAKSQILNGSNPIPSQAGGIGMGKVDENFVYGIETNTWCMLMHLSQLLYILGGVGFIIPIVMWVISKDHNSQADRHGVAIINWMITLLIACAIFAILSLVVIGIPFLLLYGILSVIFPIMAAMKAAEGEHWIYPTSIGFMKKPEDLPYDQESSYF